MSETKRILELAWGQRLDQTTIKYNSNSRWYCGLYINLPVASDTPPNPAQRFFTSSPNLLSPTQSDRSVVFLDNASPNAVAPATSKGCPEARSSAREVLPDRAVEKATASEVPNFLVLRMHMVLAFLEARRGGGLSERPYR